MTEINTEAINITSEEISEPDATTADVAQITEIARRGYAELTTEFRQLCCRLRNYKIKRGDKPLPTLCPQCSISATLGVCVYEFNSLGDCCRPECRELHIIAEKARLGLDDTSDIRERGWVKIAVMAGLTGAAHHMPRPGFSATPDEFAEIYAAALEGDNLETTQAACEYARAAGVDIRAPRTYEIAAKSGYIRAIHRLHDAGIPLEEPVSSGACLGALYGGHLRCFLLLVEMGAKLNAEMWGALFTGLKRVKHNPPGPLLRRTIFLLAGENSEADSLIRAARICKRTYCVVEAAAALRIAGAEISNETFALALAECI